MNRAAEISAQLQFRSWSKVFDMLPTSLARQTVLDLGCAIGDQAHELVRRGAEVIGFDGDADLIATAASRGLPGASFQQRDLAEPLELDTLVDGIWASFLLAYFPDPEPRLVDWRRCLRPGGWIALVEIDDLFAHAPLEPWMREQLDAYAAASCTVGGYDFCMGRKMAEAVEAAGFQEVVTNEIPDLEFSFEGPAAESVLASWRRRLQRMKPIQQFVGERWPALRDGFLSCLGHPEHRSEARVLCTVARNPSHSG